MANREGPSPSALQVFEVDAMDRIHKGWAQASDVIDLGNPATWPESTRTFLEEISSEVAGWREVDAETAATDLSQLALEHPSDLFDPNAEDVESRFRETMGDRLVLAYHATRLLPHEFTWIRSHGLEVLSWELVERKLLAAAKRYPEILSKDGVHLLMASGPVKWQTRDRLGGLYMVAPFSSFSRNVYGFRPLLGRWGGEAISWTEDDRSEMRPAGEIVDALSVASSPAIVEFAVSPSTATYRDFWPLAVGVLLGLDGASGEWRCERSIPADDVYSIIAPSDDRWPPELGVH
jgi:hypothetical protein